MSKKNNERVVYYLEQLFEGNLNYGGRQSTIKQAITLIKELESVKMENVKLKDNYDEVEIKSICKSEELNNLKKAIKTMLNIDLVEKEWLAGVEKYTTLEAKYYTIASKIRQVKFPEKKEGDYTNGKYFKNDGEYNQAITQCEEAFKFVRDFVEDK